NSGATIKNDFIELFNRSGNPVDVSTWSVQYASATGTTWQVTPLAAAGSIPANGYLLIAEAAGSAGTAISNADVTGAINMSATAGKIWLVTNTTALSGACPTGTVLVDEVSFGASSDCGRKQPATLSNMTSALRGRSGCAFR